MRDIILPARLPWPADWTEIFGRSASLVIEIGFGNGEFLLDLAQKRPDQNFLGLEISLPSLYKAERKIERLGLSNVWAMQSQAKIALWALCLPGSVAEIYINFPDPWPKPAHYERRLINDRFLHLAATRMAVGGRLSVATDDADYAAWIQEAFANCAYFENPFTADYLTEDKERLRTKYEKIAIAAGRTCHYFMRLRSPVPAPDPFPIPTELPMPHAIVTSPISLDETSRHFEPQSWSMGTTHLRLNELYRSEFHEALMVDVYLSEEPLDQRVMLVITRRKEGDYLIHLHEVGFPRPTTGIHFAVYRLAKWLAGLDPGGKIESHKLTPAVLDEQRHA
ncbi:MAG: tRNA (guanosine(46)-N7)-methyltransferase TrmB [Candidatus Promineifilaceae bacterium]